MFRKSPAHSEAIVLPDEAQAVQDTKAIVDRVARELEAAEAEVHRAEADLHEAEAMAAQAVLDGREPVPLTQGRGTLAARMDRLQVLQLAAQQGKERLGVALTQAQQAHREALWARYQAAIRGMIESGDAFAISQDEVMRCWNACGQPATAPLFRGSVQIWRENFRPWLVQMTETPVEDMESMERLGIIDELR